MILATVVFAVHALALLYDGRYSVTRQDYWRIYALDLEFPFPINALYRYNDHPTFFPSLFWLPILYFFQNNQTLLFWTGQAVTLTTVGLLLVSLGRSPSLGLVPRLAFGLIYTLASLWLGKINVTASGGFSCMTSLLMSAVVLGFLALGRLQTTQSARTRRWLFAGVLGAGIVATFSFGTGMAAWPAFLLLALFYRLGWKIAAALAVAGVVNFIIFLLLPNNGESAVSDGLSHILPDLPQIIARYFQVLGAPWIDYGSGWLFQVNQPIYLVAGIIGVLGVALAVYCLIAWYFSARTNEPAETVAVGLTIFILGSMVLIVIGRSGLMAINPRTVLATRYSFWSPFLWAALPVLSFYCWPRLRAYSKTLGLVALALAVGTIPSQLRAGAVYAAWRKASEDAALRLVCGVKDERSLQQLFRTSESAADRVLPLAEIYRQRGIDMFAWPGANLVGWPSPPMAQPGQDLEGHWRVDQVFDTLEKDQPAARFQGRCVTREEDHAADYVVITQADGKVVSLGRVTAGKTFTGYIANYSPKTVYRCHAAIDGKLEPQPLNRVGRDAL
ncbi:MAG: hypothetical protein M3Q86_03105 [Verrucomicrobiota bacterium]|nr:hypothetical protein [Verrucomicrobiota bacterium]